MEAARERQTEMGGEIERRRTERWKVKKDKQTEMGGEIEKRQTAEGWREKHRQKWVER